MSARGLKAELEPAVKILYFIQNQLEIPSDGTGQTVDCVDCELGLLGGDKTIGSVVGKLEIMMDK